MLAAISILVWTIVVLACLAPAAVIAQPVVHAPLELARARDPGIVSLMRHAQAPGVGDPAAVNLDDCATQRNLSEEGRRQARRLGEALRAAGVKDTDVRSSRWCRCVETARLLGVGTVQVAPYLNSFFAGRGDDQASSRALRAAILQKLDSRRPTLLVTHQVNIAAVTGVYPEEGEVVFVRGTAAGSVEVVARVRIR